MISTIAPNDPIMCADVHYEGGTVVHMTYVELMDRLDGDARRRRLTAESRVETLTSENERLVAALRLIRSQGSNSATYMRNVAKTALGKLPQELPDAK